MNTYCVPCGRPFKDESALNQHLRTAQAHKKPKEQTAQVQSTPPVQSTSQGKIPVSKPATQKQYLPFRGKVPEKAPELLYPLPLGSGSATTQRRSKRLPHAVGSSSSKPQTTGINAVVKGVKSQHNSAELPYAVGSRSSNQQTMRTDPRAVVSSSSDPQATRTVAKAVMKDATSPWSVITESEYVMVLDALSACCHSRMELELNEYIIGPYNPLDYVNSRKCKRCRTRERDIRGGECVFHPDKRNKGGRAGPFKCCKTTLKGCKTLKNHDLQLPGRAITHRDFLKTPPASTAAPKYRAVTLDCEMAGVVGGASEAIMLCVTDYITGAVLINRLIWPTEKIIQMRSEIHGISKLTLSQAVSTNQALAGWRAARSELWKYIDDSTILVGHALEHELSALRIIHPRVVDSGILSRTAVGIHRIRWGLKTLCTELLNIEIRANKGGIHDCLEDVLATREVVLFCTLHKHEFQQWADATREKERRLEKERAARQQEKKDLAEKQRAVLSGGSLKGLNDVDDDEDEVLHWSDIAEDLGWPHPDTGYDPWSD